MKFPNSNIERKRGFVEVSKVSHFYNDSPVSFLKMSSHNSKIPSIVISIVFHLVLRILSYIEWKMTKKLENHLPNSCIFEVGEAYSFKKEKNLKNWSYTFNLRLKARRMA
jgi:hypothetical protein